MECDMAVVDCAAMIEPHWRWDSFPFVSQSYHRGDEFQEFGLKWYGVGFSCVTAPGWKIRGAARLDDYPLEAFAGVATVADLASEREITPHILRNRLDGTSPRRLLVLKTGHADRVSSHRAGYWRKAPVIAPEVADLARELGYLHVAVDLPCDSVEARRPGGEGAIENRNESFRRRMHEHGLLLTENCENLGAVRQDEVFFASLPLAVPRATTGPCRPVALTQWRSERPVLRDVSTPLFNHWRWKMDLFQGKSFDEGDGADEIHFIFGGHGFTHCDAPCHMYEDGPTIHELPNRGLDLFIREASVIDFSDLDLPQPITRRMMEARGGHVRTGDLVILRSDLTNKMGYESRVWHVNAPNLEEDAAKWLAERGPAGVCLDFPQDYVAREMLDRHVKNAEFVAHHAMFRNHIPYIEDLKDVGAIATDRPFLMAVPLKMTCVDGAPMRVLAIEW